MRGENQRAGGRYLEPILDGHTLAQEPVHLLDERIERNDDTIANETDDAFAKNTRGNQVQNGLLAVDDERVSRIVSALKSDDGVGALRKEIDDGTFAFITPLRADDDNVSAHGTQVRTK